MQRSASLWIGLGGLVIALLLCSVLIGRAVVGAPPQGKDHPIHQAAADGKVDEVKRLLAYNPSLARATDPTGRTPLHRAASRGRIEVARALLDNGADVNARNRAGSTALRWAVAGGFKSLVELLVARGADVNAETTGGSSVLDRAAESEDREMIRFLLDKGANVNSHDKSGWAALHWAIKKGRRDIVALLLAHGANVNANSCQGGTPLQMAVWQRNAGIAHLLLNAKADVDIYVATAFGRPDQVQTLLASNSSLVNAEDGGGRTPLCWAAAFGQTKLVEMLFDKDAGTRVKGPCSVTPLQLAIRWRHQDIVDMLLAHREALDLYSAAALGKTEVIEKALKSDPCHSLLNSSDPSIGTLLHWAAIGGQRTTIQFLLDRGGDVNAKNQCGDTPLFKAILYGRNDIVEFLLDHGADMKIKGTNCQTPLQYAAFKRNSQAIELLLARSADVDIIAATMLGKVDRVAALLQANPALAKPMQNRAETPLHVAALVGQKAVAELLLAHGADVNARKGCGEETPLMLATEHGHADVAELLLVHGADVNSRDHEGCTALHRAAARGHTALVQLLVSKGADVNLKDDSGATPLSIASSNSHKEVVDLLIAKGAEGQANVAADSIPSGVFAAIK